MNRLHRRAKALFAVVGLLSLGHASRALGQSAAASVTPDESKKEEAVTHFTKGVQLMADEHWDAALAEFQLSMSLYPLKNARKNAARCLTQLGRFDDALATWQSVLQLFEGKLKPEEVGEAKAEIARLEEKVGSLVIKSNVPGAKVVVDDREPRETPLAAPIVVAAGTHVVRVTKEGYAPFSATRTVAGKSTVTVDAVLQPLARRGRVNVVEESGKALDVVIDGNVVGKTPNYQGELAPGYHIVQLRSPAGSADEYLGTQPAALEVKVDEVTTVRLVAERLGGTARVVPGPTTATLTLDGVRLGQGEWKGALRVGPHNVDVAADGYFGASRAFDVRDGDTTTVTVTLERDDNSPFWTKGRTYPLSLAIVGAGLLGLSFGSELESCAAPTTCGDRQRPLGFLASIRAAYDVVPGLGLELDVGYVAARMSISRSTQLTGDGGPVPVDLTDRVTLAGPLFRLGASYAFVKRAVVLTGAMGGGLILARVRDSRSGTVVTDGAPSPRELTVAPSDPVSKPVPFLHPELRLAVPLSETLQIGASLGAVIAVSDVRPNLDGKLAPTPSPGDVDGSGNRTNPRYQGKPIGFLGVSERATGTFVLGDVALFARVSF